jgi:hypothetical protein
LKTTEKEWQNFDHHLKSRGLQNSYATRIRDETRWLAVIDFDEFLTVSPENYLEGRSVLDILEQDVDDGVPSICLPAVPWVGQPHSQLFNGTNLVSFLAGEKLCPIVSPYGGHGDPLTDTAYIAIHQASCFKSIHRTAGQKELTLIANMHVDVEPEQGYVNEQVHSSSFALNHVKGSLHSCPITPYVSSIMALQLTSALTKDHADPAVIQAATQRSWVFERVEG